MVGKSVAKKEEIRADIKACSKIGLFFETNILKFLLFRDLLMCHKTWFVDGKRNLIPG